MQNYEMLENKNHSTPFIPYSFYECKMPDFYMNIPMHWHEEFEINRIVHGEGEFICGDHRYIAKAGDIILLPPNTLHAAYPIFSDNDSLYYQTMVFHPVMLGMNVKDRCTIDYIKDVVTGKKSLPFFISKHTPFYESIKQSVDMIFWCSDLPKFQEESSEFYNNTHIETLQKDLFMKGYLLHLFAYLYVKPEESASVSASYSELIRPALEYIVEHYKEAITIETLAQICHMSSSYFMGCFKKVTGVGAIEYLNLQRINKACRLLVETKDTISNIAYASGYSNLSNFNRQFKKCTGCSPREYRKI